MDTNNSEKDESAEDKLKDQGVSLEYSDVEAAKSQSSVISDAHIDPTGAPKPVSNKHGAFRMFWEHFNIYLLLFILVLVIAAVGVAVMYVKNKNGSSVTPGAINQQNLPADALEELAANGVQVGDPKQILNIQSNSVFAGGVLVKGELQVAGGLKIGSGNLAVPDINVGGGAVVNNLQSQTLDVAGNMRAGDVNVLRNLSVNGNSTFTGGLTTPSLSVGRLQLNGDLSVTRHIVAGGATPNRTNGGALGNGGTSSVSGSDTAGSISINTGGSPAAGCFATMTFTTAFGSTPHVVLTPVGSAAAGVGYYVNRSNSSFSVCAVNPAPANSSFGFDYHIFE